MAWALYSDDDQRRHVVPMADGREHVIDLGCWCGPWAHPEDRGIIVHRSCDGREDFEPGALPRPQ